MKIFITSVLCALAAAIPTNLFSQEPTSVEQLVEMYSTHDDISHTKAGKGIIWFVKASAPKGAMDGVEKLDILKFEGGTQSASYQEFRTHAVQLFESINAPMVDSQTTDKGSSEVYMQLVDNPTQYMMFMHNKGDEEIFMWMRGKLKLPKKGAEKR